MKTLVNLSNNPIKKTISNSIQKKEILPCTLQAMKINVSQNTEKVLHICTKKRNGTPIDIYILKDKYGNNIGSRTLYPNILIRSIDIIRNSVQWDKNILPISRFDTINTTYKNSLKLGNRILQKTQTFSETYKKYNPPLNSKKQLNTHNLNSFYHFMVRVKEKINPRGHKKIFQEVLQIEGNKNPIKKFFKLDLQMKASGDTEINSYTHSKNVELNTDNPYFTIGLLQAKDMIKGRYRALAKKNKMDGIEPPLYFDNVENRSLGSRGGVVPSDNSYVGINFSLADDKTKLVKILGHECEHLFKQNAYIHLSGLQNMMSENIISKRFFRGIEKRFNLIKKNTQKYQDAVQCLYEKNNYEKLVVTNGEFDINKYNNLYKEKCANLAGEIEVEDFQEYLKDLRQNFSLFNRNYVLQKK